MKAEHPSLGPFEIARICHHRFDRPVSYHTVAKVLAAAPDATLAQHCERWAAERGVRVSVATRSRAIRRLGVTVKKSPARQ